VSRSRWAEIGLNKTEDLLAGSSIETEDLLAGSSIETVEIRVVPYDHTDAVGLIAQVQQEYVVRYGGVDRTPVDPVQFAPPSGLFLVGYLDSAPIACGGWRTHGNGAVEVKRMYVAPPARGRGLARAVLAELERTARQAGHRQIILETGLRQPEAVALYHAEGYRAVPGFGVYRDAQDAIHLGKLI
jgi:GNAT superfamily N-acetyltransferase